MIDKIRHGAEITSDKLNEVITQVNTINNDHKDIRELSESVEKTVATVYNKLEEYSEQVSEHLDSIPEIKNLYSDILLARDSVDWIEIASDTTDVSAQIANALSGYSEENEEPAQRLRIIRGPKDKIETVEKKDKQILIGYELDEERNVLNGILYFDYYDSKSGSLQRCPVSSSRDTTITISAPELSFFTTLEGEVKLQASYNGTVQSISPNLKGEDGASGIQGPKGEKGDKGEPGNDGAKGDRGPQGEDGPATLISVMYSQYSTGLNPSDTYQESKHKYMGIRSYLSSMTVDEVKSQPIKWFRITGDTLYPVYDKNTGCLTFTTTLPDEPLNFYIKGEQGPKGDKGEAPSLAFKVIKDGKEVLQPISYTDANGNQVYDLTALKGEKGESIKFSELTAEEKEYLRGEKGDKGDKPTISFMVEHTDKEYPSIKDTTPIGSPFDAVFTISIPKAKDGADGERGTDGNPGTDGKDGYSIVDLIVNSSTGEGTLMLARDVTAYENGEDTPIKNIPLGKITGDKGEDGKSITGIALTLVEGKTKIYTISFSDGSTKDITILDGADGKNGEIGPQGPQGEPGKPLTFSDLTEQQKKELKGEKGDKGDNGTSLNISQTIYSEASSLPAFSSVNVNNAYIVKTLTSYDLYFKAYDGETWTIIEDWGGVEGPQGPKGDPGTEGTSATITLGEVRTGNPGTQVVITNSGSETNAILDFIIPQGEKGDKGDTFKFTDLTDSQKEELKGAPGSSGKDGNRLLTGTEIASSSSLSTINFSSVSESLNIGDLYLNTSNYNLYKITSKNSNDTYTVIIIGNIQGPQGEQGIQGIQGEKGETGSKGIDGENGRGITTIDYVGTGTDDENRTTKTYRINFTDGKDPLQFTLTDGKDGENGASITHSWNGTALSITSASGTTTTDLKGAKGDQGNGIISINKTASAGHIDTYTIKFSNNTESTFTVTNGIDGTLGTKGDPGTDGLSIHVINQNTPPTTFDIGSVKIGDHILINTGEIYTIAAINGTKVTYEQSTISIKGDPGIQGPAGSYVKATKIINGDQAVSLRMEQSVYYELTNSNITAISLSLISAESGTVGEYIVEFTINSGNNIPSITLPSNVKYANNWEDSDYESGHTYIIYILNNIAYVSYA